MRTLQDYRKSRPVPYPDPAIHAEFACSRLGLTFEEIDGGTGLVFRVTSATAGHYFGGGRCSAFPQNDATAATLATDKYFTNRILEQAGMATLGGQYFFLHARHQAYRQPGHERSDAMTYVAALNHSAFVKPLHGSRGDFAQPLAGAQALLQYLDEVSQFYDSILIQPIVTGNEYRIFLLDQQVVYIARKHPPFIVGDGVHSLRELIAAHDRVLQSHGLSPASVECGDAGLAATILPAGQRHQLPGRMNRSAGGTMTFATPPHQQAALALAQRASQALGLRVAAVDIFTEIGGDPAAMAVIEINANPSIRFLEDSDRADLILRIWRHTFTSIGLLHV
jgi:D-alanine-D-alanine ligase-like ATP-grasp enzyme